jgi:type II secretory pathway pseudopilin PulG
VKSDDHSRKALPFELLVVIVISGILAAMLTAVASAKVRAQAISCLNNMRQLGLGMRMYIDDHQEDISPAPLPASTV